MMLLRSLSSPILNSWLPNHSSRESSPEPESQLQRRNRSFSFLSSKSIDEHSGELLHQAFSEHKESTRKHRRSSLDETNQRRNRSSFSLFSSKSIDEHSGELLHQALSENKESPLKSSNNNDTISRKQRRSSLDETKYTKRTLDPSSSLPSTFLLERLFSSSGMGEKVSDDSDRLETLVSGGGMGNSGGKICTGGGVGGSGVDGGGTEEATDTYYKEMIELNPGNSLLTGNYAKFLKEVKGDMKKAEEYCERAILGNTNDGNVLSLYADLILQNHGDRERADSYFQQAIEMSQDDCYVHASYARFLWDVEEDEDEDGEEQKNDEIGHRDQSTIFHDFPQYTHITASS